MSVLIIAEAGVNHNGDLEIAKKLILAAAQAGADIIKFQTFKAKNLLTRSTKKAAYQAKATGNKQTQFEMIQKLELSKKFHIELIKECKKCEIGFLSTAFDKNSFDMLMELGINIIKIPSGEITNLPFLRHISKRKLPIILSTGMASLGEIETAINNINLSGTPRKLITVLHCTTEYPTEMVDVNLLVMKNIKKSFGVQVGYSDHSKGIEVPIAAVALGANVIEKHFTLDRELPGPDHQASLEPDQLKAMVKAIRNVEVAIGDGVKTISANEIGNRSVIRKSIVAIKPIKIGEKFTIKNIGVKRPGTGLSPMLWDHVIGKISSANFAVDDLIKL